MGNISWQRFCENKEYTDVLYQNIKQWDDSGALESFQNAKARFYAAYHGEPCGDIPPPDPDMYIDEVDHECEVDPELVAELDAVGLPFEPEDGSSAQAAAAAIAWADDSKCPRDGFANWETGRPAEVSEWDREECQVPEPTGWGDDDDLVISSSGWGAAPDQKPSWSNNQCPSSNRNNNNNNNSLYGGLGSDNRGNRNNSVYYGGSDNRGSRNNDSFFGGSNNRGIRNNVSFYGDSNSNNRGGRNNGSFYGGSKGRFFQQEDRSRASGRKQSDNDGRFQQKHDRRRNQEEDGGGGQQGSSGRQDRQRGRKEWRPVHNRACRNYGQGEQGGH